MPSLSVAHAVGIAILMNLFLSSTKVTSHLTEAQKSSYFLEMFISMPLRVGLGLLMAGMFLPFINEFVAEFADWMGKLLPL